jgi:hypothetical protein
VNLITSLDYILLLTECGGRGGIIYGAVPSSECRKRYFKFPQFSATYTTKTASYYASSAAIFTVLTCFFLFNLWQLRISYLFQAYLEEVCGKERQYSLA